MRFSPLAPMSAMGQFERRTSTSASGRALSCRDTFPHYYKSVLLPDEHTTLRAGDRIPLTGETGVEGLQRRTNDGAVH
jgi:hypothetical protein